MKKLFLLLAFFGTFALNYSYAQTASTTEEATEMTAADEVAAADETIVVKTCEHSGAKSYYKKTTAEDTGKVSMTKVTFNASTSSFSSMPAAGDKKAGCSPSEKASCAPKAKATTAKAGCCSSGAKKSCSGAKSKVKT
jgi:hypothetical protein